jgi:structural maintenance of chromosomes protein 5
LNYLCRACPSFHEIDLNAVPNALSLVQRLGRSDNLKEFVRKGATKGQVELIISGGPSAPDYRIERIMWAKDTKSQFRINGAVKTQKDVEALNAKLTIQLDNLCQFLPQEKVVEFSKMSPTELLLSTERAIGNGRLADMHEKLISGGGDLRKLQDTLCAPHSQNILDPIFSGEAAL